MRIGQGIDVHAFADDRPLWLGGIRIPSPVGLLGHSDADVLIHAICDALLGAANLKDIGHHFPDTDDAYKNIDSKILLRQVTNMLSQHNYKILNIDATLCAQKPKIASFIPAMQECLAKTMEIPVNDISIKATTTEHLGFVGRQEGILATAIALITDIPVTPYGEK